jgi:protease YdgD
MRTYLLATLLLLALPAHAEKLKGIKGEVDHRVTVPAKEYPWSAVGRVNNGQGAHCSGMMIGPRLAVTAAHCLWNKRTRAQMPASSMTFVAAWERGEYLMASKVARVLVSPHWQPTAPYSPAVAADDWALLELEDALGEQVGWVALGTGAGPAARVVTVGYGQDKPHVPTAHMGCGFTGRTGEGLLLHDCDAVHGDSGGPIMEWQDGALRLVAIHVATLGSEGKVWGGAVPVAAFAAEARKLGAAPTGKAGALSLPGSVDFKAELGR